MKYLQRSKISVATLFLVALMSIIITSFTIKIDGTTSRNIKLESVNQRIEIRELARSEKSLLETNFNLSNRNKSLTREIISLRELLFQNNNNLDKMGRNFGSNSSVYVKMSDVYEYMKTNHLIP